VLRVLTHEVNCNLIEIVLTSPIDPVLIGGIEINNPEPTKQCRVHLGDIILGAVVDSCDDSSLRVETKRFTVHVVTELTVQNDLEEALHDLGHRAVELIEHQNHWLTASTHVPGRKAEGSDTGSLRRLEVRDTRDLRLIHRGAADIDERKTDLSAQGLTKVRLTYTGGPAHQNGHLRRELRG
jgi:hypothetical protein